MMCKFSESSAAALAEFASGYEIKPSMLSTMHRLRTWDFRTQVGTSTDRNLRFAFNELYTLKDKLGLPDTIIEKTAYTYRKAQERRLARGRSVSALLADCYLHRL